MPSKTPIGIFLAATAALATNAIIPNNSIASETDGEMGGLKEWTTDQEINDESTLDKEAKKAKKKAEDEGYCVPVGEGENCW